jgi:WD40 repeat protein
VIARHDSSIIDGAWSPDGRSVATGDFAGTLDLWDVASGRLLASRQLEAPHWPVAPHASIRSLEFSPDGHRLVAGADTSTTLWDSAGLRFIAGL